LTNPGGLPLSLIRFPQGFLDAKVRGVEAPLPQPDRRMIRAEGHKPGQVNGFPPGTPSAGPKRLASTVRSTS